MADASSLDQPTVHRTAADIPAPDETARGGPAPDDPAPHGPAPGGLVVGRTDRPGDGPAAGRDPGELFDRARRGDRRSLARLLSMAEAGGGAGRAVAAVAYRWADEPATVGITGAPGAGKSTLTGRLVGVARQAADRVAVVAVDPTSPFSGGAVLGDRIRMQDHSEDDGVFIRSMATRGHLGGLSVAVPEAVRVLGAAGWSLVLVETVGVGQVEVEVASATDTVVVVVNPRWGDAIQANKAGLLEVADVFVVNKADLPGAAETRRDLEQMLDMAAPTADRAWRPPVVSTVAAAPSAQAVAEGDPTGVTGLWEAIQAHQAYLRDSGELDRRRRQRLAAELQRVVDATVAAEVARLVSGERADVIEAVLAHRLDPYQAAAELLAGLARPS
jgi:LAO/AO transport system kinase